MMRTTCSVSDAQVDLLPWQRVAAGEAGQAGVEHAPAHRWASRLLSRQYMPPPAKNPWMFTAHTGGSVRPLGPWASTLSDTAKRRRRPSTTILSGTIRTRGAVRRYAPDGRAVRPEQAGKVVSRRPLVLSFRHGTTLVQRRAANRGRWCVRHAPLWLGNAPWPPRPRPRNGAPDPRPGRARRWPRPLGPPG